MSEPIIYVSPEKLARWKRKFPIHWQRGLKVIGDNAIIRSGKASPAFVHEACLRAWDTLLSMYDLACPTERHRQKMRRGFRLMLAEFPIIETLYPHFRQRLGEHDMFVKQGLEPLDPDEIEGGCHGTA